ncbi:YchJ family protein [Aeromonas schubertii]|uniref:YchJ family protein n=1 Tax=Aeromonas schubertii TaxID=652 RepID=UPI00067EE4A8|nr:YchJ family protein [Aeromonas schubertii]KUE81558.1 zinc chelation protein SecC [Aeromonas schubertii]QCG48528.1 zinc chelation protein SecC [Aeromonas schubertii]
MSDCPCGQGRPYADCCQPLHLGAAAPTPEALMRSRYCAFVLGLGEYLVETWHPDHLGGLSAEELGQQDTRWDHLEILGSGEQGDQGWVEFKAWFQDGGQLACLHERSRFLREAGRWRYTEGEISPPPTRIGRNDPCPCGSGKKFKKCCAS